MVAAVALCLTSVALAYVGARRADETTSPFAELGVAALGAALVLSMGGSWLKTHTHHRGLGGVTFAIMALVTFVGLWALVASKTHRLRGRMKRWAERLGLALLVVAAGLLVLWAGVRGLPHVGAFIAPLVGYALAQRTQSRAN